MIAKKKKGAPRRILSVSFVKSIIRQNVAKKLARENVSSMTTGAVARMHASYLLYPNDGIREAFVVG